MHLSVRCFFEVAHFGPDRGIHRALDAAEQAERTNAPPFLIELCDLLGVERPEPASGGGGPLSLRAQRHASRGRTSGETTRRIDLYRRDCFILEAKQGANAPPQTELFTPAAEASRRQAIRNSPGWAQHMLRAKGQAEGYVRDLPSDEPAPPFLIVCDVGFCFDIYADFSGTGRHYAQFPDREGFRVYLADLRRPEIRARLARSGHEPHALDPARRRTEVTREIAEYLARLARALEARYAPRCRRVLPHALPVLHVRAVGRAAARAHDVQRHLGALPGRAGEVRRAGGRAVAADEHRWLFRGGRGGGAAVQRRTLCRRCRAPSR